eukprot:7010165-Prymnesium_polylepis.4
MDGCWHSAWTFLIRCMRRRTSTVSSQVRTQGGPGLISVAGALDATSPDAFPPRKGFALSGHILRNESILDESWCGSEFRRMPLMTTEPLAFDRCSGPANTAAKMLSLSRGAGRPQIHASRVGRRGAR